MRRVLLTRQAVAIAAVAAAGVMSAPAIASAAAPNRSPSHAAAAGQAARPALPAGQRYVCPPAPAGQMACMSIIKTAVIPAISAVTGRAAPLANGPYVPSDLQKAYRLVTYAAHNGRGRTVAIVDAYADPHANADLAKFRKTFRLPACTTSNGCLHIYNQKGAGSPLPRGNANWAVEESLDLDMVSAVCPLCHIDLIEAKNNSNTNLYTAENTAARKARYVSNSWGNSEYAAENQSNHFFNHPGHVIAFAAGDLGYGTTYPASVQYVTSIGGTSLRHSSSNRGWTESVWGSATAGAHGTASGCSTFEAKPSWQRQDVKPGQCTSRTENDAAAVADPNTGVVIYDSYGIKAGFYEVGGTSAATPIITAIYALAGTPVANTYPAQYPYLKATHLFDVTTGVNGTCGTGIVAYLCHGQKGFDGPTGLGTPNGTAGFHISAATRVTLVDPGTVHATHGQSLTVKITGLDTRKVSQLRWTWTGTPEVPPGLSIHAIPNSTNGQITGTPTTPGTYNVTVTAHDGTVSGTTHFAIIVS